MKDNTQVFESYSVPRAVRTLALPSMMGMLVNIVYNLADTFFVGQTGNANMVAAVSVTMPSTKAMSLSSSNMSQKWLL